MLRSDSVTDKPMIFPNTDMKCIEELHFTTVYTVSVKAQANKNDDLGNG